MSRILISPDISDRIYTSRPLKNWRARSVEQLPELLLVAIARLSFTLRIDERLMLNAFPVQNALRSSSLSLVVLSVLQTYVPQRIVSLRKYPDLDQDHVAGANHEEIEEDIDIEVNEREPSFLSGQTKITLELSPVKIVKAPDG